MSGTVDETLTEQIEETRIVYEQREHGVRIHGQAFTADFDSPVDPEAFCDEVTTADEPWQMFGLKMQLSDDYWKVVGNLLHAEGGELVDASKISFEVAPQWVRIYVKEGCSAERAAEFVRTLDEEYGISVNFPAEDQTA